MEFQWPDRVERIPEEEWVTSALGNLALKYDTVERHGWYANLEPTLDQLLAHLEPGQVWIDYSGGTGILVDRLFRREPDLDTGVVIVDASPKFLRLAVEKLGNDPRVAFRWCRYLKPERRLQTVEEALAGPLLERGADALASTNAIHLYYGLDETLASWHRALRPGARAFVQSGNIDNPDAPEGSWIIDETVGHVHKIACEIVAGDEAYAEFREVLGDPKRMTAYDKLRNKYFLPVRPLQHYLDALTGAGFRIEEVSARPIEAEVKEWCEFLSAYHEGVLGWVGGVERIEGKAPTAQAVETRLSLIRAALERLFEGQQTFQACWTYITALRP